MFTKNQEDPRAGPCMYSQIHGDVVFIVIVFVRRTVINIGCS